ncbi:MAG: DUF2934 domain-containing protein [Devosia sp.]
MSIHTEETIRSRAYELWEHAGRPDGHDKEFWAEAERELSDQSELDRSAENADTRRPPVQAGLPIH